MAAIVPLQRPLVRAGDVVHGEAVRSSTWYEASLGANYVVGAGNALVPWTRVPSVLASGTEYTYAFPCYPSPASTLRRWLLAFDASSVATAEPWTVAAGAGPTREITVTWQPVDKPIQVVEYDEQLSSYPTIDVLQTLALVVRRRSGSAPLVAVSCIELPRVELAAASPDLGADLATVAPGEPIRAGHGIGAVRLALTPQRIDAFFRRHLIAHAWPHASATANEGLAVTGSAVTLYSVPMPMLTRARFSGETERPVRFFVRARATGGDTLRVTATNAKTSATASADIVLTGTQTTYAITSTLPVDTEDGAFADGLRGGTLCTVNVTLQRISGSGTIYVSSIAATEAIS